MSRTSRRLAWLLLGASLPALAAAHSTLKSTTPPSGSILAESPKEVVIQFNEPARLISATVVPATGEPERKLEFSPKDTATTFTLRAPELAAGRNEIRWKALSKDGHPIGGTLLLVVKPASAASSLSGGAHHGS